MLTGYHSGTLRMRVVHCSEMCPCDYGRVSRNDDAFILFLLLGIALLHDQPSEVAPRNGMSHSGRADARDP